MKKNLETRILVSITGSCGRHWRDKLAEVNRYNLERVCLFLECFDKKERKHLPELLLQSCIKEIPLIHIRTDVNNREIEFYKKHFKTKYFTIHEDHFSILKRWHGHYQDLYLEMNYDNKVAKNVEVQRIGGFCVDLSHYKASASRQSADYVYTLNKAKKGVFACNHLNGYSARRKKDVHTIKFLHEFNYLRTIPIFLFGRVMAIEVFNSIKEQLKFKKFLIKYLDHYLKR